MKQKQPNAWGLYDMAGKRGGVVSRLVLAAPGAPMVTYPVKNTPAGNPLKRVARRARAHRYQQDMIRAAARWAVGPHVVTS